MKATVKFLLCFLLCATFAIATETAPEPTASEEIPGEFNRFYGEFFKMMSVLILIVLFLALVTWSLKRMLNSRFQKMRSDSLVQIVDRRMLTPKTTIYILSIMEKTVVIAESHNGVTALGQFSASQPPSFSHFMDDNSQP